ncbi:MAG: stage II sporulation protein M [Bacteroidetes bacterium]|jgi:uncharacterized membrane protein SpoIIM required for sporulation|nr:stage II sporulation protein M [Bacteroidota bacterium]
MREVTFLKQNAEKWKQFERLLREERTTDPDELADLFVQVTDDLSYAQTFYPESKTTRYLNELAAEAHAAVYRNRREDQGRLRRFWTIDVPRAVREAHRELVVAAVIFGLAIALGAFSAVNDTGFARLILGDAYVNMTLENIEQGDPMAVYKKAREVDMAVGIALNNVRVAFLAFAAGVVAAVGTAFILFQNGVMLGAFHTLFYQHDLLGTSLLVVYIHGALEISAIIIAGAAGLTMGKGLLFPGTFTRLHAFRRGARRGAIIVIGLVPVFLAAALLEGFVTRHTTMPVPLSLAIILGSLAFVGWYFVWYPRHLDAHRPSTDRSPPAGAPRHG